MHWNSLGHSLDRATMAALLQRRELAEALLYSDSGHAGVVLVGFPVLSILISRDQSNSGIGVRITVVVKL